MAEVPAVPPRVASALDGTALMLSMLCLVHCLALPLLVALLPLVAGSFVANEAFHRWMLLAVVPTSALAFWIGFRSHRGILMLWFGATGVLLLACAAYGGLLLGLGAAADTIVTVCGGLALASAHGINRWRSHQLTRRSHLHGPACGHGMSGRFSASPAVDGVVLPVPEVVSAGGSRP